MPAEASEQLLPCRDHRIHVARAGVLAILPGGAEVTLHDPLVAMRADGVAQNLAHRRVGHPAVDDVDALLHCEIHQTGYLLLVVARHPLRAKADLADLKPGPAQTPVFHGTPFARYRTRILPGENPAGTHRQRGCSRASTARAVPTTAQYAHPHAVERGLNVASQRRANTTRLPPNRANPLLGRKKPVSEKENLDLAAYNMEL